MSKWKDSLSKISGKSEKEREAAFEAAMLAEIAKDKPKQPSPTAASPLQSSSPPSADSITISVTEDGKTTTYSDLASVPLSLRQRVLNVWLSIAGK